MVAVAALQTGGHLSQISTSLDKNFSSVYVINGVIGLLSSIIDNVPMVAAVMAIYSLGVYAVDSIFWELLAFCAGTGGSILIIGSASDVAIMGVFRIYFMWYIKNISWVAILGYLGGILTFALFS